MQFGLVRTCLKAVAKLAAAIAYLVIGGAAALFALWGLAALVR